MALSKILLPGLAGAAFLVSMSAFTVNEWEKVVEFRLGEIVKSDFEPGLHFKIPFVNTLRRFDGRVLTLPTTPERFLTSEKKNLIVDFYIKWQIEDPAKYFRATRGDERAAAARIAQIVKDGLKSQFSSLTIRQVVSGDREQIKLAVADKANRDVSEFGVKVIDVRIMRIDLPPEVSSSVYQRMEKERATVAKTFRSRGEEEAKKITADADRQREEILAEAYRESQSTRGEGDAKASEIYAAAYGQDPEFFAFYRSLNAYSQAFDSREDLLVLQPDSPFFRYMREGAVKPTP
ncbi:MAG: protease modulator HflC [Halothiobacillaceae bacterium]|nr:protease modulator HflC [Halothiobacillaceae bacterium]